MDFYETVLWLTEIDNKLDEIRKLSKNQETDFRHYPFNNDFKLIEHILNEFIERQKELK
ncbi:hypothetical protein QA612_09690 [Evansella sp. AB-P1]|uniref:hypothetical protein n=1 Tax=Evansella sp. AB-P1 TaxID=3037653 RepID=UPI00241D2595|nr:hypothetical protein [Evansella sp. AB-P1]MDG5787771.1 hypothetical protein [Evansella sp. AB-P1]